MFEQKFNRFSNSLGHFAYSETRKIASLESLHLCVQSVGFKVIHTIVVETFFTAYLKGLIYNGIAKLCII
jgi:hypothetical protein